MTTTVYVVGEPGAGKTTLLRAMRLGWVELSLEKRPVRHVLYETHRGHVVPELGWPREGFGGTDALPMDAVRHAEPWLASCGYPLVLAEGDRLACARFFDAARAAGELVVVHLAIEPELAAARRAQRGTVQNPAWVQGRATKVARLVATYRPQVVLDASRQPDELADDLVAQVPALGLVA